MKQIPVAPHFASVTLALLQAAPAFAQSANAPAPAPPAPAAPSSDVEPGTIVVTAQRTAETLQRVPMAVSAFLGAQLDKLQFQSTADLKLVIPNFSIERNLSNASTPKLYIRGIGVSNAAFSFDSPIGIYVDDVYYPRVIGSLIDFIDVDRIEVLRGPQGNSKDFDAIGITATGAPDFTYHLRNNTNNKWTWRAAVNHQANRNLLVYASAATGFRAAALNGNAQSLAEVTGGAFGVESTLMYEAGLKSTFLNGHATFNAAGYYGKYTNLQQALTLPDGSVSTTNNDADVYGIELEAQVFVLASTWHRESKQFGQHADPGDRRARQYRRIAHLQFARRPDRGDHRRPQPDRQGLCDRRLLHRQWRGLGGSVPEPAAPGLCQAELPFVTVDTAASRRAGRCIS